MRQHLLVVVLGEKVLRIMREEICKVLTSLGHGKAIVVFDNRTLPHIAIEGFAHRGGVEA